MSDQFYVLFGLTARQFLAMENDIHISTIELLVSHVHIKLSDHVRLESF